MRNNLNLLFDKFDFKKIINILFVLLIGGLALTLLLVLNENNNLFIKAYRKNVILTV